MNKKGIIGILALFLMFALVLFGAATALVTKSHYKNMVNRADGIKALYIAEAGMERAIWKLRTDSSSQDTGVLYSNEKLGDGFYTVVIKGIDVVDGDTKIILESTGVLGSSVQGRGERRIQGKILIHSLSVIDLFNDYALFWGNTENEEKLSLHNNILVTREGDASGDVFANGDIEIYKSSEVSPGLVYATGKITGEGKYTSGGTPDPIPPFPELDTSYYDSEIQKAHSQPHSHWDLRNGDYHLGGTTLYINGDVDIHDSAHLYGPGKIVATGKIHVHHNSTVSNVDLIAGKDLKADDSVQITGYNLIYGEKKIDIHNSTLVEGELISPGDIDLKDNSVLKGILYSGHHTELKHSEIHGSVFSDGYNGNEINEDVQITHDKSYIPSSPPPGLTIPSSSATQATLSSYEELPLS